MKNLVVIILICLGCLTLSENVYSQKKVKDFTQLQKKVNDMRNDGSIAVLGKALATASRDDQGMLAASLDGKGQLSAVHREYVEKTASNIIERLGIKPDSEEHYALNEIIETATSKKLSGVLEEGYWWYQTKEQKKEGLKMWGTILYISPKILLKSIDEEVNKKDQSLYERFIKEKLIEEHDKQIKEFEEKFGVE